MIFSLSAWGSTCPPTLTCFDGWHRCDRKPLNLMTWIQIVSCLLRIDSTYSSVCVCVRVADGEVSEALLSLHASAVAFKLVVKLTDDSRMQRRRF